MTPVPSGPGKYCVFVYYAALEANRNKKYSNPGDVLGPSMHNLHQLLHMPVGCGEQVMTAFAPDIFVANYLAATNQLSSDIKDKALIFMEKGKQK